MTMCCTICSSSFDLKYHLPYVVPCGHSICEMCKAVANQDSEVKCAMCNSKFELNDIPINYAIKVQLEQLKNVDEPGDGTNTALHGTNKAFLWNCCECRFALHPRQARLCIKCCPKDLINNNGTSITIRDYEKCEERLICAHCVMEGDHKFHITKVYMPMKMSQMAEDHSSRLIVRIKHMSHEEKSKLNKILNKIRVRSSDVLSLAEFEQVWTEADARVAAVESNVRGKASKIIVIEEALKDMELYDKNTTEQLDGLNYLANSASASRRASKHSRTSSDDNDETSNNPSLKRFDGSMHLSTL